MKAKMPGWPQPILIGYGYQRLAIIAGPGSVSQLAGKNPWVEESHT